MRLLKVQDLTFYEPPPNITPRYAIASHRWADEVSFQDVEEKKNTHKSGYEKIEGLARYVREDLDGIEYLWYDSCCIDRNSSAELSENINSMFRYYREAEVCLAYLADVERADDLGQFERSVWHKRGWTLQELLASKRITFLTKGWDVIGYKGIRDGSDLGPPLESELARITGIPEDAIVDLDSCAPYGVDDKLQWTAGRSTTKPEDMVYCLLGLLGVYLPVIYGEGEGNAKRRLRIEIGHVNPTLEKPQPTPMSIIPYQQDPDFVERPILLAKLQANLKYKAARVALVGLGGAGKTQLAAEYAYRLRETAPQTWVLWLHASSLTRLLQSVQEIVQQIEIDGYDDKNANFSELLRKWLTSARNGPWLLVIDNLDDANVVLQPHSTIDSQTAQGWLKNIPQCEHGAVMITSRSMGEARKVVYDSQIIEMTAMDIQQAEILLQTKLRDVSRATRLKELAIALDCMPLAMSQAAAFIRQRASLYSTERYLNELLDKRKRNDLLTWDPKFGNRDEEASSSILLTWQISFEHLRNTKSSAADLLSLMSLCDRQAIPRILFCDIHSSWNHDSRDHYKFDAARYKSLTLQHTFEDDIVALESFAFISATTSQGTWQMHRLVQDATRLWITEEAELETWKANLALCLSRAGPKHFCLEDWPVCQILFPHVRSALDLKPTENTALLDWAQALYVTSHYAENQDRLEDAEVMAAAATAVRTTQLGLMNMRTLQSKDILTRILRGQGHYEEARHLQEEVVSASRELVGSDGGNTLTFTISLAHIYACLGRYRDAEESLSRVLALRRQKYGEEDARTLSAMKHLATIYLDLGKYKDAEILLSQTWEVRKRLLGDMHPETLASMHSLATTYIYLEKYEDAENLFRETIALRTTVLGEEHPQTLNSMTGLGQALVMVNGSVEAERLITKVLEVRKRSLGEEHPETLWTMVEVGNIYSRQDRHRGAADIERRALDTSRRVLGEEYPITLTAMHNLADDLWKLQQLEEAEQLMSQAVEKRTRVFGAEHKYTIQSIKGLEGIRQDLQVKRNAA